MALPPKERKQDYDGGYKIQIEEVKIPEVNIINVDLAPVFSDYDKRFEEKSEGGDNDELKWRKKVKKYDYTKPNCEYNLYL